MSAVFRTSHVTSVFRERFTVLLNKLPYQLVGPPEVRWGNFKEVSAWGKVHGYGHGSDFSVTMFCAIDLPTVHCGGGQMELRNHCLVKV